MNTQHSRTPALTAAVAVVACLAFAGCGTETAAPAQDTGVSTKHVKTDPPGTHKLPPDFMP